MPQFGGADGRNHDGVRPVRRLALQQGNLLGVVALVRQGDIADLRVQVVGSLVDAGLDGGAALRAALPAQHGDFVGAVLRAGAGGRASADGKDGGRRQQREDQGEKDFLFDSHFGGGFLLSNSSMVTAGR